MTWTDPGMPIWALILLQLSATNGLGLVLSLVIERWGLPAGWSIQAAPRKPGTLRRHLPLIGLNYVIIMVLSGISFALFSDGFHFAKPGWVEGLLVFGSLVLIDDFGFYWVHRILHRNKELYRRIHKLHHKAYAPVPIEYFYAHPIEWMAGAMLPVFVIAGIILIMGSMNAWLLMAWIAFRQLHELDIHSGTKSPIGDWIPLWGKTLHHDLHHAKPNLGNYASTLDLWDRVFQTRIAQALLPGRKVA